MQPTPYSVGRFLKETLSDPVKRFRLSLALLLLLVAGGTIGFIVIEGMGFVDALYMAVTTVTTVGFGEVQPFSQLGRVFTICYVISGVGVAAWAITTGAEIVMGDKLWISVQERKLRAKRMALEGHFIICGYGRLGRPIANELASRRHAFVVIELAPAAEEPLVEAGIPFVIGDASQEDVLRRAGVERAAGIVVTLDSDAENVLTVLTARELNPNILIVARANSASVESKMARAGADHVLSPDAIGGRRLAIALLQPTVHDFLEKLFNIEELDVNVEQVRVAAGSVLIGQTMGVCPPRAHWGLTILAVRTPTGEFIVSPDDSRLIEAGETLIVIGAPEKIAEARAFAAQGVAGRA